MMSFEDRMEQMDAQTKNIAKTKPFDCKPWNAFKNET